MATHAPPQSNTGIYVFGGILGGGVLIGLGALYMKSQADAAARRADANLREAQLRAEIERARYQAPQQQMPAQPPPTRTGDNLSGVLDLVKIGLPYLGDLLDWD